MKIHSLLLIIIVFNNNNFSYSQKSDSEKPKAKTSIERKVTNSGNADHTEEELRKELSGKYEGILEIPYAVIAMITNTGRYA